MTYITKIPTANLRYSTMANSQEAYLGVSEDDRQLKLASETRNTYTFETMKGAGKILTTYVGFKTCRGGK